jgi:aspartate/methionine/tyrosine aminotransferase
MQNRFIPNEIRSLLDVNLKFNLGESTSADLFLHEILDEKMVREIGDLKLGYGTSQGSQALREAIGEKLNVSPQNVLTTNGSIAAIFMAVFCLCEKGDEVITVTPNFPPTLDIVAAVGATRKTLALDFDNGYQLKASEIEKLLSIRTKLIILVSPHNPSGKTIPESSIIEIFDLIKTKSPEAYLLIDETFRDAVYGEKVAERSFANYSNRIITTASVSKAHGAPGLRTGWLSCHDEKLMEQLTLAKLNTVLSGSPLDEFVANIVLQKEDEILGFRRQLLEKAVRKVESWVDQNGEYVEWIKPDAGAFCCVRLRDEVFSDAHVEEFYGRLPTNELQLGAGNWFQDSRRIFRLGFGYLSLDVLEQALEQLQSVFQNLKAKSYSNRSS